MREPALRDRRRSPASGLAFKPDVDDLRESPAVEITRRLALTRPDLRLLAVEPYATDLPPSLAESGRIELCALEDALSRSDVVLLLVHHAEFVQLDLTLLRGKQVVDTRGLARHPASGDDVERAAVTQDRSTAPSTRASTRSSWFRAARS